MSPTTKYVIRDQANGRFWTGTDWTDDPRRALPFRFETVAVLTAVYDGDLSPSAFIVEPMEPFEMVRSAA